ncbi:MAG: TonB-dependent receptor [Chromatiales bacterium]|nr:TonB-dependent receptor [Chromatiales bacterium]
MIADPRGSDVPGFGEQFERFLRRPGAETVVDLGGVTNRRLANLEDALEMTPGIFTAAPNQGSQGLFSIRGSDIATAGPRNGRGIRAFIDGVPVGRTEAGLTTALIDLQAAQYVEVYRGPNSLRFGAIASGGALNFVSKTGRNFMGTGVQAQVGSFDFWRSTVEQGWQGDSLDAYVNASGSSTNGFRGQSQSGFGRVNANIGWQVNESMFSRSYVSVGFTRQELADALPLNEIRERRREAGPIASIYDQDINFDYLRLANRTSFDVGESGQLQVDAYFLATRLDHLPSPFAGLIDNTWLEGGAGVRWTDSRVILGLPVEVVSGLRVNYTDGDFQRYQHRDAGRTKGPLVSDQVFEALLVESYGETAWLLTENLRVFLGLQAVYTTRKLQDFPIDPPVEFIPPIGGIFGFFPFLDRWQPNPGSSLVDQSYDRSFRRVNPKLGLNRQFSPGWFVFASIAQSYEVPTGADLADRASAAARLPDQDFPELRAQSAWTAEVGIRGGGERVSLDLTLYHMALRNEILTRCDDPVGNPGCPTTVAFNADRTLHQGLEFGGSATLLPDLLGTGSSLELDLVYNLSRFRFLNDEFFGSRRLPVIPRHAGQAVARFEHPSGFYFGPDYRYIGSRAVTYDGSGGSAFVVPAVGLWGLRSGWRQPAGTWEVFVQATNLTDKVFVSTFNALPTQPFVTQPPPGSLLASPSVRPGEGRAWYFGVNLRL